MKKKYLSKLNTYKRAALIIRLQKLINKKYLSKLNGRKKIRLIINQPQLVDKLNLSKLKSKHIKSIIDWILIIYEIFK